MYCFLFAILDPACNLYEVRLPYTHIAHFGLTLVLTSYDIRWHSRSPLHCLAPCSPPLVLYRGLLVFLRSANSLSLATLSSHTPPHRPNPVLLVRHLVLASLLYISICGCSILPASLSHPQLGRTHTHVLIPTCNFSLWLSGNSKPPRRSSPSDLIT